MSSKQRKAILTVLTLAMAPALSLPAQQSDKTAAASAPITSSHFVVTVDGKSEPVLHAAMNLYFLNFEAGKKAKITVTADSDNFWASGVEIQPWRFGIRPVRTGRTISFSLEGPAKISISRPGDFLSDAEMLYLFANPKEKDPPTGPAPNLQYFGPGEYHQNLDAVTGGAIYLAPGAVVYGGLNVWGVDHVRIFGRGTIVYDGPQDPLHDDGYMHKKNWHCIVMDNAHDVSVEGITCVTRSRTWQVQMKGTRDVRFDNFKQIGANQGNANADGMDWLDGSGDTLVRDSFVRAADDDFALQDSWEGYGPEAFAIDGVPVKHMHIEDSVVSTSISNVVRAGWPEKSFAGGDFSMTNVDVIHAGLGGCGIPFALMEVWADPHSRGEGSGFHFDNIRLEDWYSLLWAQQQPVGGISDITFKDIFALETPSTMHSEVKGRVHGVSFDNVSTAGGIAAKDADLPISVIDGADEPTFAQTGPTARVTGPSGLVRPGQKVRLEAARGAHLRYEWSFGDGTYAHKRVVKHRFPDSQGTLLDNTGRFRVLLHVTDANQRNAWSYTPVVVAQALQPAISPAIKTSPGLLWQSFVKPSQIALSNGITPTFNPGIASAGSAGYEAHFSGLINVPGDGGYVFTLLANDAGSLTIDGKVVASTPAPFANVCGLAGNAVRPATASIALARGLHQIEAVDEHSKGEDGFRILWQGPNAPVVEIPASVLSHEGQLPVQQ